MVGMAPYPQTTNKEPSAMTDIAAFGKDAADTTWQFMHNDGTGTATKVNTTITITDDKLLEFFIFCPPNGSTIYWELRDLEAPSTATGSVTTDLISTSQWVSPHVWGTNVSGTSWSRLAVGMMYAEADY
jgi:hypothetical protein